MKVEDAFSRAMPRLIDPSSKPTDPDWVAVREYAVLMHDRYPALSGLAADAQELSGGNAMMESICTGFVSEPVQIDFLPTVITRGLAATTTVDEVRPATTLVAQCTRRLAAAMRKELRSAQGQAFPAVLADSGDPEAQGSFAYDISHLVRAGNHREVPCVDFDHSRSCSVRHAQLQCKRDAAILRSGHVP